MGIPRLSTTGFAKPGLPSLGIACSGQRAYPESVGMPASLRRVDPDWVQPASVRTVVAVRIMVRL